MKHLSYRYEDKEIGEHLRRLSLACFGKYDLQDVVRYIEDKTYLNGERFSFLNHEFQKDILSDTHPDLNVQKCAQVGLSEAMARYCLAVCRVIPYFKAILTQPGANDCQMFFKTRIDPIIDQSPDLRDSVDGQIDNTSLKAFGGSLLYGRGTRGTTQALSVPADMVVHDEVDRSDPFALKQFQSRLKHSKWKMTRKFGTPTIPGFGIALAMDASRRFRHLCKCDKCNEWFAPNYHDHVVIPDFYGDKKEINEHNLLSLRWEEAYVQCPKCGRTPSLQMEHRQWVCENPEANLPGKGYFVTPFSVPNVVSIAQIVKESTRFTWHEFCNQTLGETSSETSESLTEEDIRACQYMDGSLLTGDMHCLGIDLGHICHMVVGRRTTDGLYLVVHRERVTLDRFWERLKEIKAKYRILTSVWDWQPYTPMVLDAQKSDPNLYGGRYVEAPNPEIVAVVSKEESAREAKMAILIAKISRNLHFDEIMQMFKKRQIIWQSVDAGDDTLFIKQCLDMKRTLRPDKYGEGRYAWIKQDNDNDHYHHALGYMITACRLMPATSIAFPLTSIPIARKIKIATPKEIKAYARGR